MNKGKLYLIPTPLGDNEPAEVLPAGVIERACSLRVFVVEEIRTARRFLSRYGLRGHIAELEFHELNEHSSAADVEALGSLFDRGEDVGLLSEAGLPAVADPGAELVALCHRRGVEVIPLVGPSSLMLALMASGLNGQSFAFCGYVPAKPEERRNALRALEKQSAAAAAVHEEADALAAHPHLRGGGHHPPHPVHQDRQRRRMALARARHRETAMRVHNSRIDS